MIFLRIMHMRKCKSRFDMIGNTIFVAFYSSCNYAENKTMLSLQKLPMSIKISTSMLNHSNIIARNDVEYSFSAFFIKVKNRKTSKLSFKLQVVLFASSKKN